MGYQTSAVPVPPTEMVVLVCTPLEVLGPTLRDNILMRCVMRYFSGRWFRSPIIQYIEICSDPLMCGQTPKSRLSHKDIGCFNSRAIVQPQDLFFRANPYQESKMLSSPDPQRRLCWENYQHSSPCVRRQVAQCAFTL